MKTQEAIMILNGNLKDTLPLISRTDGDVHYLY